MIPIAIQCSCGQRFAFNVEPVAGHMPNEVVCTVCGCNLTEASDEQIRQHLAATVPPAAPAAPTEKSTTWMVVTLCVAVVVLLGLIGGAYFYFDTDSKTTTPPPTVASAPEPAVVPVTSSVPVVSMQTQPTPTTPETPIAPVTPALPTKSERNPSLVAVGALFDRNAKTRQIQFTRILPNSTAEKAGIVVGDILLKVNKKSLGKLSLKEIADMFYGPVGSKITLDVLQSATGKTNRFKIVRKKYAR